MYKPLHFRIEELVSRTIYNQYKDKAWAFFDKKLLVTIDQLREFFDVPLIINDWAFSGSREFCGYRSRGCMVGAENSQHRMGRAADIICETIDAQEMRLKIIEKSVLFPHITYMEDKTAWVHIDVRQSEFKEIKLFKP